MPMRYRGRITQPNQLTMRDGLVAREHFPEQKLNSHFWCIVP